MELVPIEKKVKFRNKYWHLKLYGNGYIQVFPYNDDGSISENFAYADHNIYGDTMLDKCKNAIAKADNMLFPYSEYKDVAEWDGDMDKELNIR